MSFKSWQSFWTFQHEVEFSTRYIFSDETQKFLEEVLKTSASREQKIAPKITPSRLRRPSSTMSRRLDEIKRLLESLSSGQEESRGVLSALHKLVRTKLGDAGAAIKHCAGDTSERGRLNPSDERKLDDLLNEQRKINRNIISMGALVALFLFFKRNHECACAAAVFPATQTVNAHQIKNSRLCILNCAEIAFATGFRVRLGAGCQNRNRAELAAAQTAKRRCFVAGE